MQWKREGFDEQPATESVRTVPRDPGDEAGSSVTRQLLYDEGPARNFSAGLPDLHESQLPFRYVKSDRSSGAGAKDHSPND